MIGPLGVLDLLEAHADARGDAPALRHPYGTWSWTELLEETRRELDRLAGRTRGARVVVSVRSTRSFVPVLLASQAAGICLVPLDGSLPSDERELRRVRALSVHGTIPGVLVHTSGTTDAARAALLGFDALLTSARLVANATDLQPGDAWLSSLPLAHVGGLGVVLRCVVIGATMVLSDRFDADRAVAQIGRGDVTHASFVARMLDRILRRMGPAAANGMKASMVGGGPAPRDLLERARAGGLRPVTTWGLSEAGSTVTLHRPNACPDGEGSAGWPLPGVRIRIVDPGTDGAGSVAVAGPTLMAGYDAPGEARLEDGWLVTADVGRVLPDGRLVVLDRRTDLIVTGGENVAPSRVEAVLSGHPAVDEVAVVGMPDPSWGQQVVAVVRVLDPALTAEALRAWAASRLSAAERPRRVVLVDTALPRGPTGKLRRNAVRSGLL